MEITTKRILLALLVALFFSTSVNAEFPEKLFDPFGFGQLQDTVTILKHLEKNNISINEFIKFIEEKKESFKNNGEAIHKKTKGG